MFLIFIFAASTAHATALLVCTGADGVVVSADSRGHSLAGEVEDYDKLQLVGERVVVAEAGLLLVRDRRAVRFDVHDWVARATRKLGSRPSAAAVAHTLAQAARRELPALTPHPSVAKAPRPQIILLIADQQSSVVRLVVDLRPFDVREEPQPDAMVEVGIGAGHLDDTGPLLSLARRRRPSQPKTLAERADWCGLLLTIESELNPTVGLPIRQALLPTNGVAQRRVLPSGLPPTQPPAPSAAPAAD